MSKLSISRLLVLVTGVATILAGCQSSVSSPTSVPTWPLTTLSTAVDPTIRMEEVTLPDHTSRMEVATNGYFAGDKNGFPSGQFVFYPTETVLEVGWIMIVIDGDGTHSYIGELTLKGVEYWLVPNDPQFSVKGKEMVVFRDHRLIAAVTLRDDNFSAQLQEILGEKSTSPVIDWAPKVVLLSGYNQIFSPVYCVKQDVASCIPLYTDPLIAVGTVSGQFLPVQHKAPDSRNNSKVDQSTIYIPVPIDYVVKGNF